MRGINKVTWLGHVGQDPNSIHTRAIVAEEIEGF
jgi:hypothetical protein